MILEFDDGSSIVLMSDNTFESFGDISGLVGDGGGISCYLMSSDAVVTIVGSK